MSKAISGPGMEHVNGPGHRGAEYGIRTVRKSMGIWRDPSQEISSWIVRTQSSSAMDESIPEWDGFSRLIFRTRMAQG